MLNFPKQQGERQMDSVVPNDDGLAATAPRADADNPVSLPVAAPTTTTTDDNAHAATGSSVVVSFGPGGGVALLAPSVVGDDASYGDYYFCDAVDAADAEDAEPAPPPRSAAEARATALAALAVAVGAAPRVPVGHTAAVSTNEDSVLADHARFLRTLSTGQALGAKRQSCIAGAGGKTLSDYRRMAEREDARTGRAVEAAARDAAAEAQAIEAQAFLATAAAAEAARSKRQKKKQGGKKRQKGPRKETADTGGGRDGGDTGSDDASFSD